MENRKSTKKDRPLRFIWNLFSTLGGIFSLSNVTQKIISDWIAWKGFLQTIFNSYDALISPLTVYIFGWFPWPILITNYMIFGAIVGASRYKSILVFNKRNEGDGFTMKFQYSKGNAVEDAILWPFVFLGALRGVFMYWIFRSDDLYGKLFYRDVSFYKWLGAILFGVIILISVNAAL